MEEGWTVVDSKQEKRRREITAKTHRMLNEAEKYQVNPFTGVFPDSLTQKALDEWTGIADISEGLRNALSRYAQDGWMVINVIRGGDKKPAVDADLADIMLTDEFNTYGDRICMIRPSKGKGKNPQ